MTFFTMYGPHVTRNVTHNTRPSSAFQGGSGNKTSWARAVQEPNSMLLILLMLSSRYPPGTEFVFTCYVMCMLNKMETNHRTHNGGSSQWCRRKSFVYNSETVCEKLQRLQSSVCLAPTSCTVATSTMSLCTHSLSYFQLLCHTLTSCIPEQTLIASTSLYL